MKCITIALVIPGMNKDKHGMGFGIDLENSSTGNNLKVLSPIIQSWCFTLIKI